MLTPMLKPRLSMVILLTCSLSLPAVAMTHARRGPTSPSSAHHRTKKKKTPPGPRGIDDERATQIQAALIKSGYLTGSPSGHWDAQSQAAMQKLQGDNGWQTKLVPDSRALIKLGLGPATTPAPAASTSTVLPAATQSAAGQLNTASATAPTP